MKGTAGASVTATLTDHVEETLGRIESQLKQGRGTGSMDGLNLLGLVGVGRVIDRYSGRTGVGSVEPRSLSIGAQPADCLARIWDTSLEYRHSLFVPGVNTEFVHRDKSDIELAGIGIGPKPQRQRRRATDRFRRGQR